MNKSKIKYISILVFLFMIFNIYIPKNVYANEACSDSEYQCITCEATLGESCKIIYTVKANGKGGASQPEFTQELISNNKYAMCKYESSVTSTNFIDSNNSKLICPNNIYYVPSVGNSGNTTIYSGKVSFSRFEDYKKELTTELKKTYDNNKSFKSNNSNNENYKSCEYTSSSTRGGVSDIKIYITYNNGNIEYETPDNVVINSNDLTADIFESNNCPTIFFNCGTSRDSDKIYCSISKNASDADILNNYDGSEGEESENSDDLNNPYDDVEYNTNIDLGAEYTCTDLRQTKVYEYIKDIFYIIQIIVPIILLVMGSLDFVRAVAAQKDDDMKKAQSTFIKRLIIAVAIFLIPAILNLLFSFLTDSFNITTCGIGTSSTQSVENE